MKNIIKRIGHFLNGGAPHANEPNHLLENVIAEGAVFCLILDYHGVSLRRDQKFLDLMPLKQGLTDLESMIRNHLISEDDGSHLKEMIQKGEKFCTRFPVTGEYTKKIDFIKAYTVVNQHNKSLYTVIAAEPLYSNKATDLDLFEKANIPAVLINADSHRMVYNKLAEELIKDKAEVALAVDGVVSIDGINYKVSRFRPLATSRNEIIVFAENREDRSADMVQFLERSTIPGALIDANFNLIMTNEGFDKLMSAKKDNIDNFIALINEDEHVRFHQMVGGRKKGNMIPPQEFHIPKYNKTILLNVNPVLIEGKLHYSCGIFDITKYKTLEMEFVQSQKMQAIGQLAGSIAHDFNNLLTAILGFCDLLLLRHGPGDKSFNDIMQVKQNANRAAGLVRQLLAFSRKQVLISKILDVSSVVAELSNLLIRLLGENVRFEIEYGKSLDFVKVDHVQLEQVIVNLAVNARDAMGGIGDLLIRTSNITIDESFNEEEYFAPVGDEPIAFGKYVLIEVKDTGTGIPADVAEKMFDPFFSTKDQLSGTGLGLATVYGIIKQTGGYIRFRTQLGVGTSFFIFLKVAQGTAEPIQIDTNSGDKLLEKLLMNDNSASGKILIVEDEISVRLFTTHALNNKGYDVVEADNAEAAMDILNTSGEDIQVVITDVMMPGMTGPQMVEMIRVKYPHIKFIFTSGYAEDSLEYLSNSEHHFLAKPFTLNELATKVKEVIAGE